MDTGPHGLVPGEVCYRAAPFLGTVEIVTWHGYTTKSQGGSWLRDMEMRVRYAWPSRFIFRSLADAQNCSECPEAELMDYLLRDPPEDLT